MSRSSTSDDKKTKVNDNISTQTHLPRNNTEYSIREYWEERFEKEEEYDWLFTFSEVQSVIHRFIEKSSKILIVGCGNSSFSVDLYDAGYLNITSIDYSYNVINRMKMKYEKSRPKLVWQVMDMTEMSSFSSQLFDVVIDKAAMDALLSSERDVWNPKEEVVMLCRKMCSHVSR